MIGHSRKIYCWLIYWTHMGKIGKYWRTPYKTEPRTKLRTDTLDALKELAIKKWPTTRREMISKVITTTDLFDLSLFSSSLFSAFFSKSPLSLSIEEFKGFFWILFLAYRPYFQIWILKLPNDVPIFVLFFIILTLSRPMYLLHAYFDQPSSQMLLFLSPFNIKY